MRTIKIISLFLFLFSGNSSNAQWIQTTGPGHLTNSIVGIGTYLFAGTTDGGVFRSSNYGDNWVSVGLSNTLVFTLGTDGNDLYAGTWNSILFKSTDYGDNWIQLNPNDVTDNDLNVIRITFIYSTNNRIFVGRFMPNQNNPLISVSTDHGLTWASSNGNLQISGVYSMVSLGTNLYLAAGAGGVYNSTDLGTSWNYIGLNETIPMTFINNSLFASSYNSIFSTSDNGTHWNNVSSGFPYNIEVTKLVPAGQNLFAASTFYVYLTTNFGSNWLNLTDNLPSSIYSLYYMPPYLYAGTSTAYNNGTVYRRDISGLTGINGNISRVPGKYSLSQNFPNPFNPSTKISYDLPKSGLVTLSIYDVLGRQVALLVNQKQNAGTYEVNWDASNSPSGIYFYRLQTNNFVETKKLVLIK